MVHNRRNKDEEKEKLSLEELKFLQNQMSDEERRREVIEGKTGQLLGQVSIVVSVIALFIPLISDQVNALPLWEKIISIFLFLIVVIAFITSIWIASTSWIINRYGYNRPDLDDMHQPNKSGTRIVFIERYKEILSPTIRQHIEINNTKGTNLIRAGIAFRLGILLLGVLVVGLSVAFALAKNKPKEVNIMEPVKITVQDSSKYTIQLTSNNADMSNKILTQTPIAKPIHHRKKKLF